VLLILFLGPRMSVLGAQLKIGTLAFTASGTVEVKATSSTRVVQVYTNRFTVAVNDGQYITRLAGSRPRAPSLIGVETLFDGTNTFVFRRYDTNYAFRSIAVKKDGRWVEQPAKKPLHSKNTANVEIAAGHFPRAKDPASMLLWLAFAAQGYYEGQSEHLQPPVLLIGPAYEVGEVRFNADWTFCQGKPGFLQERVDYDSGKK
jgi:hypothetical protein